MLSCKASNMPWQCFYKCAREHDMGNGCNGVTGCTVGGVVFMSWTLGNKTLICI